MPTRGFLSRWAAALVVATAAAAFVAVMAVSPPFDPRLIIRADGAGYHIWTYAILKGDPSFGWYPGRPEDACLHPHTPGEPRYTCKYPPGVALVRLPVMAWVSDPDHSAPPYSLAENFAAQALGALALIGVVVLGLLACRELELPAGWSQFSVLALTFGTGLYHYGTFDAGFSHVYTALGVAWLVWQGAKARNRGGRVPMFAVAAVSLLLVLIRATNVLLVGFWAAGLFVRARQEGSRAAGVWAAVAGAGLGLAALLALNYSTFGRITLNSYPGEHFLWDRPMMRSVLFSPLQGLVPYYPVLVVAIGVGLMSAPTRQAAAGLAALVLGFAALYGFWWSWHLGQGFGHRGFVDLVPFAFPVLAAGLTALRPRLRWVVAVLILAPVGLSVVRMFRYWEWAIGG